MRVSVIMSMYIRACIKCHLPWSQAFMAAQGPAFKENHTSSSFDNIQLYNLECGMLLYCIYVYT